MFKKCLNNVIHHSAKEPEAPSDFRATNSGSTEVTLEWTRPKVTTKGGLNYTVSSVELFSIFDENCEGISETSCTFLFLCLINSNIRL